MIKVSVFYPNSEGSTFDMDYYCNNHMPMIQGFVGEALYGVSVDAGLAGMEPGAPPAYVATGYMLFDSVETFQAAFGPHAEKTMADIPNYTNIEPIIQISEVKI